MPPDGVVLRVARQGIGARLRRQAVRRCAGSCPWTTAWVGNPRARGCCEREGFTLRRIDGHAFEGGHHDHGPLVHALAGGE